MAFFSFIHAADLHLGSAFQGIQKSDPHVGRALRQSTYTAFERVIDLAITERVDFVVFAGDTYNSADGNLQAHFHFQKGARRLDEAGIRSFVVRGNHDPLSSVTPGLEWPASMHLFGPDPGELIVVKREGDDIASVTGMSYRSREVRENLSLSYPAGDSALYRIGALHGNCGGDPLHGAYAPCTLDDLRSRTIDYWALGHIHRQQLLCDDGTIVAYSGSAQGLNPKETGDHGCYLVRVDEQRQTALNFHSLAPIRWVQKSVDIDTLTGEDDLLGTLAGALTQLQAEAAAQSVLVRFRLEGHGTLHERLTEPDTCQTLTARLREEIGEDIPFAWPERIIGATAPPIDIEMLARAQDFLGDFLRLGSQAMASPEVLKELRTELRELFDHQRARSLLRQPTDEELQIWLEAARLKGASLMLKGESTDAH